MPTEEQLKVLELALAEINREYGANSIARLDSTNIEPWPALSTGVLTVDIASGIGGFPLGRIVEIYGENATGKTTLALSAIAEAQKQGLICAYIDIEHALDPYYMQALGVDVGALLLTQPDYGEAALNMVQKLANTGCVSIVVVDSVSALVPKVEIEGQIGSNFIGLQARMMSQALRILAPSIAKGNTCVVFVNQIREKMTMYGNPNSTSGGRALKFYSSMRIELSKKEDLKTKDGQFLGVKSKAKFVKNKCASAYRTAEYDILYGQGIDSVGCIADSAVDLGFIRRGGAWFTDVESSITLAQGRDGLVAYLKEDEEYRNSLVKKING